MSEKSIVQEARDIQLAMELITLGARLQMLESETQLSRGRLIKLYKELRGSPPPKGMLPFSTDWFMTWEQNIHASMFCNAWQYLLKTGLCSGVNAVIKAYKLYLEQCPQQEEGPLLALTRAWTLVRFVEKCLSCRAATAATAILLPMLTNLQAASPVVYVSLLPVQ